MSTSERADAPEAVTALWEAADRLETAEQAVAEVGEADLEALAEAHEEFGRLLSRYEEPATGDGDFQLFIEFQGEVAELVEDLPADLPRRAAFEDCDDLLQQRRLSESDFARVRERLSAVGDLADRLADREEALSAYRLARRRLQERGRELDDRTEELERLLELGEADLDAPVEVLREPIDAYDRAVEAAFDRARREWSARDLLTTVERLAAIPLVGYRTPPASLLSYVRDHDAGAEPLPRLLEYADYSRSKLDHYVDDADALKRAVGTRRTYLRGLDAGPLTVDWPPPPAGELRYRCRELTGAVDRLTPEVVEQLRAVAALPRRPDYDRLREATVARAELAAEERERLQSGAVTDELARVRREREQVTAALADYPER